VNQISREFLNGRIVQIVKTGLKIKDFFESKIFLEDVRLDFLPQQSNPLTQVMYIDKNFVEKCFLKK
jgi:hypothetical protein